MNPTSSCQHQTIFFLFPNLRKNSTLPPRKAFSASKLSKIGLGWLSSSLVLHNTCSAWSRDVAAQKRSRIHYRSRRWYHTVKHNKSLQLTRPFKGLPLCSWIRWQSNKSKIAEGPGVGMHHCSHGLLLPDTLTSGRFFTTLPHLDLHPKSKMRTTMHIK